jgi:hypothetical protein
MDLLPGTSKEEDPRFTELLAEITRKARVGDFEAGGVLLQMVEEKVFGPWGCFRDLVTGALRITEVDGYRWINITFGIKSFNPDHPIRRRIVDDLV